MMFMNYTKEERSMQRLLFKYNLPPNTNKIELAEFIDKKLEEQIELAREHLNYTNRQSILEAYN